MNRRDLLYLLRGAEKDLDAARAKLTELGAMIAHLPIPDDDEHVCPDCRVVFRGPVRLEEHRYYQHDGPVPAAWKEAVLRVAAEDEAA